MEVKTHFRSSIRKSACEIRLTWFRSSSPRDMNTSRLQTSSADVRTMQVGSLVHQTQWLSVTSRVSWPNRCCRQKHHLRHLQPSTTNSLRRVCRHSCTALAKAADGARTDTQQLSQSLPDSREQAVRMSQVLCAAWCLVT